MYDEAYIRAEQAYRAQRIRDEIIGHRERKRLRQQRSRRGKGPFPGSLG